MKVAHLVASTLLVVLFAGRNVQACQTLARLPDPQMAELETSLADMKGNAIKRLQAYEVLSCSNNPSIRTHAMTLGIHYANPPMLRGRVLLDILAAMPSYLVEIDPNTKDEQIKQRFNGSAKLENRFVDLEKGCISLFAKDKCTQEALLQVRGMRVELIDNYSYLVGQFELDAENVLTGRVKFSRNALVPAKIRLFGLP